MEKKSKKKVTKSKAIETGRLIRKMKESRSEREWNFYCKKVLAVGFKKKSLEILYGGKVEWVWKIEDETQLVTKCLLFLEGEKNKFKVNDPNLFYLLMKKNKGFRVRIKGNFVTVTCVKSKVCLNY